MLPKSIRTRLTLSTLAITLVFVLVTSLALEQAYKNSLRAEAQAQMELVVFSLLAAADISGNQLKMPLAFQNSRLNELNSGLMAWVSSDEQLLWQSDSTLWHDEFNPLLYGPQEIGEVSQGATGFEDQEFFYRQLLVLWETPSGEEWPLTFTILLDQQPFLSQVWEFRRQLWVWLGIMALGLMLMLWLLLTLGLQPLKRLAVELFKIEHGRQSNLTGIYPTEISPVKSNLNRVLSAEIQQRQRYQQTLADLAHSLKTPLAVMRTTTLSPEQNQQLDRMDQIIGYQLARAVVSKESGFVGQAIVLEPLVQRLVSALSKVYSDVVINIKVISKDSSLAMDEKDLMEVLGNIIENACKYGFSKVRIELDHNGFRVHDDGPGVPENRKNQILQRGVRLDTLQQGQGIGLAVVFDILNSYEIDLAIDSSDMGGACFKVQQNLNSKHV